MVDFFVDLPEGLFESVKIHTFEIVLGQMLSKPGNF